jgi:hypothetical protein
MSTPAMLYFYTTADSVVRYQQGNADHIKAYTKNSDYRTQNATVHIAWPMNQVQFETSDMVKLQRVDGDE